SPFSRQPRVTALVVIEEDPVDGWVSFEQSRDGELHQQSKRGLWKQASKRSERRLTHHRITKPVRSAYQDLLPSSLSHRFPCQSLSARPKLSCASWIDPCASPHEVSRPTSSGRQAPNMCVSSPRLFPSSTSWPP